MECYESICRDLIHLIQHWEPRLQGLSEEVISQRKNGQNRSIKQILGHMIDSASNNTHRIIHLQYQPSPCRYPDYANLGNNDRWIAIQNYQHEDWNHLVQLWKYSHLHIMHVIRNIDPDKLDHIWISALDQKISLNDMVTDYPRHFKLHCDEINALIYQS